MIELTLISNLIYIVDLVVEHFIFSVCRKFSLPFEFGNCRFVYLELVYKTE